ncbi:MAG: hypothetical protein EOM07_13580 [Clostridia bacterium]|nr:hypothetical protein [Clostridia bacterium]
MRNNIRRLSVTLDVRIPFSEVNTVLGRDEVAETVADGMAIAFRDYLLQNIFRVPMYSTTDTDFAFIYSLPLSFGGDSIPNKSYKRAQRRIRKRRTHAPVMML